MKIAIVTDSSCDLPQEFIRKFNINVVPLRIHYSHGEYRDGVDITPEEIIDRLDKEIPKTSMPSPEDMVQLFRSLETEGYTHAIVLSISSGLSGTYNTFRLIAQESSMKIDVLDSKGVSWLLGFLVLEAARLIREKLDYHEILHLLEEAKTKIKAFFVLDTLEYVQFGGRIGKVAAALGSVLHLKPIITFDEEGKLSPHTLARGKKQAFKKMLEPVLRQINETRSSIAILHSKAEEEARAIKERLKGQENVCELYIGSIGPALSVHAGPGLIGIVVAPFSSTHSN